MPVSYSFHTEVQKEGTVYDVHPDQGSKWSRAFWARGYYVATVGNITDEAIKRYIQEQQEEAKKEEKSLF